ncbi:hypothetical protein F5148DRAFT_958401, partial [Russula earlei]
TRNHPPSRSATGLAPEATLGLLREHAARSVTYVSLVPLTNLVRMLWTGGACVRERISRVVIIGGALDVPGDATPSAECACFNFRHADIPDRRACRPRIRLLLDVASAALAPVPWLRNAGSTLRSRQTRPSVPTAKTPGLPHFLPAPSQDARAVRYARRMAGDATVIAAVRAAIAHLPGTRRGSHTRVDRAPSPACGVVDRPDDQKPHAPGANRAHVDAELKERMVAGSAETGDPGSLESVVVPAVEDEPSRPWEDEREGTPVVEGTPGAEALLRIMLKRIW